MLAKISGDIVGIKRDLGTLTKDVRRNANTLNRQVGGLVAAQVAESVERLESKTCVQSYTITDVRSIVHLLAAVRPEAQRDLWTEQGVRRLAVHLAQEKALQKLLTVLCDRLQQLMTTDFVPYAESLKQTAEAWVQTPNATTQKAVPQDISALVKACEAHALPDGSRWAQCYFNDILVHLNSSPSARLQDLMGPSHLAVAMMCPEFGELNPA
ncbi:hypothetical protein WJX73_003035 [Symbiochloris irregularis]|uniref:Uncharacterized protein n=1 Tax=Symbiochloris irregularis TaxID=706552 RepID=A0AAW1NW45_9CHLO